MSEKLPAVRHRNGVGTTVRQRHPSSNLQTSLHVAVEHGQKPTPLSENRQETQIRPQDLWGTLLSDIAADIVNYIRMIVELPRRLCLNWKWVVLVYFTWLAATHAMVSLYLVVESYYGDTLCSVPIIGPRIPACIPMDPHPIDPSRLLKSHEGLNLVMKNTGEGFKVARMMVNSEFDIRGLRVRVRWSNLPQKDDLLEELGYLISNHSQATREMSKYTARVHVSVNSIRGIYNHGERTVHKLSQKGPIEYDKVRSLTLPERIILAVHPFAAFGLLAKPPDMESEVKRIFWNAATTIRKRIKLIIQGGYILIHTLDQMQGSLGSIQQIMADEKGRLPHVNPLIAVWLSVADADDRKEAKSQKKLLTDIIDYYEQSGRMLQNSMVALHHINAELTAFSDELESPGTKLHNYPLEVIANIFRESSDRLKAGLGQMGLIEKGEA